MGNFGDAERHILELMHVGAKFIYQDDEYTIIRSGKPTCYKGEPKTDIYVWAESGDFFMEIKISYKKENADFIENKMNAERAEQLFGPDWAVIIEESTTAIRERFNERMLIYKNQFRRTEKGAITLGWKFELMNKLSGDLSGQVLLDFEQVVDVYAGKNLSEDKKNAMVNGKIIKDSGVANTILIDDCLTSAQDVIDNMIPIEEYVRRHPEIYFACKALNYRSFAKKWDGNRPLSVQVDWNVNDGKLSPHLIFDRPLLVGGNEVAGRLLEYMKQLNIRNTDDITDDNVDTDKIV